MPVSPALGPIFVRGALLSPFKRPRPGAGFADFPVRDGGRLVLPDLRVDVRRLADYERVCGFATGEESLPITYPHVLGFPLAMSIMSRRDFPLPLLGLVHTSVDITRHRPLPAAGTYELAVHVDRLAPHRRGTEATVVTVLSEGGERVWESTSTYLARHRAPEGTASGGGRSPSEAGTDAAAEGTPGVEWRLGSDVGRRYAAASGDRNPIHLSPLTARLFGFPRAIAHGMWTVARCLAAQTIPPAAHVHADFRAPVLLPSTVAFTADADHFALRAVRTDGGRGQQPGGSRVHVTGRVTPLAP